MAQGQRLQPAIEVYQLVIQVELLLASQKPESWLNLGGLSTLSISSPILPIGVISELTIERGAVEEAF